MPILPLRNASDWLVDATRYSFDPTITGGGSGTVTSVDVSGGTTGLVFTGGAITVAGTITAGGTLAVANGGTGTSSLPASGYVKSTGVALTSQAVPVPLADGGTNNTATIGANAVVFSDGTKYTGDATNFVWNAGEGKAYVGGGATSGGGGLVNLTKNATSVRYLATSSNNQGATDVTLINDSNVQATLRQYGSAVPGNTPDGLPYANLAIVGSGGGPLDVLGDNGHIYFSATGPTAPMGQFDSNVGGNFGAFKLSSSLCTTSASLTLANGLNSNIVVSNVGGTFYHVTGPSGAFSLGGFNSPVDGRRLTIYNGTFQTMTIVNEDASSTATNRIKTLTGANYVLPVGAQSVVELVYDSTDQRWILTNDGSNLGYVKADGTVPLTANWAAGAFNIISKNSLSVYNAVTGYGMSTGGTAAANTTALNQAITDANAAGGGVVYIPAGNYAVNAITLKQFVTLQGDGMFSTILAGASAVDIVTIDGTASTNVYNAIRDLCIASSGSATRCLNIKNAWFVDVHRCRIATGSVETILVTSTAGVSSTHIQFSKCWLTTGAAAPVVHGSGNFVTGLQLNDCEISGGSFGVVMDSTDGYDLSCYGSIFEGISGPGVKLEGSAGANATLIGDFTDCYFESNTTADVDINPSAATGSFPQVSIKGGQSVGSTARFIRMNSKTSMLHVSGVYSNGHGTADIDLGDLSTTTAVINITGNNLTSATKILSTNPATPYGFYPFLPGVLFAQTASATVANTVAETSLIGSGVGTLTIPANVLTAGKTVRIRLRGTIASTGTPTLRINFKFGGSTINGPFYTLAALTGTVMWEAVCEIQCRTAGAGGTGAATANFDYHPVGNGALTRWFDSSSTPTFAINTTTAKALDITVTWGAASPSNTITSYTGLIELLNN